MMAREVYRLVYFNVDGAVIGVGKPMKRRKLSFFFAGGLALIGSIPGAGPVYAAETKQPCAGGQCPPTVNRVIQCTPGQHYSVKTHGCIPDCPPGHVMDNGNCVPK
jgi:hypothetical protein